MKKIIWIFLWGIFLFGACQKENIDETTSSIINSSPDIIIMSKGEVVGKVLDDTNNGIFNAIVRLGSLETTTNENGLFFFENADLNSQATYLTVEKEGYFHGSRTFVPTNNTRQNILIQLIPKNQVGSFLANQSIEIIVKTGTILQFQDKGILDSSGNPYNGEVQVFAERLDPRYSVRPTQYSF